MFGSRTAPRAAFVTTAASLPASGCVEWSTFAEGTPLTRYEASLVYDPVRERMILFGGTWSGGSYNDVWVQSLSGDPGWSRLAVAGAPPPPMWGHRALYDPVRDRMLVFGGGGDNAWGLTLSGTPTWERVSTVNGPSLGMSFALAYDPVRDRAIVFGGSTEEDGIRGDTWALSLESLVWTRLPDGPTEDDPRAYYDPSRDRLVVLGGVQDGSGGPVHALTLSGTPQWSYINTGGVLPGARMEFASAYDPVQDRLLLFGGYAQGVFRNDVWRLDLAGTTPTWNAMTPSDPPPGRSVPYGIWDAPRERFVIFGGRNFQDTWALPLTAPLAWSPIDSPNRPPTPRAAQVAVWDAPRDRMIVFGGEGWDDPTMSDVRALSLTGPPIWSALAPAGTEPAGRADAGAIFDPVRERMVLFGGRAGSNANLLADAWALSLAGPPAWSVLPQGGQPPGKRSSATTIYDPVRDRMILFGGYDQALDYHNDVFAYDLSGSGTWQRLFPAGTPPPPRVEHCAVYDPVRDRMLVIGGYDRVTGFLSTVWALSLAGGGAWSQLTLADAPPPTRDASAVYDPVRDRVLLYGGSSNAREVYALELSGTPRWTIAATNSNLVSRTGQAAIFDAVHDRMLVFGGVVGANTGFGEYRNDVLALTVPANTALLSIEADPAGAGTVAMDPASACLATGATVTLTAVPVTGYVFAGWDGDASGSENPLTITMDASKHVVARFIGHVLAAQASPAYGGSVIRSPDQPTYAPGTVVTLTATPATGYGFVGWSGDALGKLNPLVVTVDRALTITASFVGHEVVVTSSPPDAGAVFRSPEQPLYGHGTSVMLTARPKNGHAFVDWSGDASGPVNPLTFTVDVPKSILASFEAIPTSCGGWSPGAAGPSARRIATTVWDPRRERLILFGGYNGNYLNDTWAYKPATATWTQLAVLGPGARGGAVAAYDSVRDAILLHGGNNGTYLNDTYLLSLGPGGAPAWMPFPTTAPPPARFLPTLLYDGPRHRYLLFGGWSRDAQGRTVDPDPHPLWELEFTTGPGSWRPIDLSGPPPTRYGHAAVYDPRGDRMLILGGAPLSYGPPDFGDVWAMNLWGAQSWQELRPAGEAPPARSMPIAVLDPERQRVIVFGGQQGGIVMDDTWTLSLAHEPSWANLSPYFGPTPPGRSAAGGGFDHVRGQLLIFGGYTHGPVAGNLGDTWCLGVSQGHALDLAIDAPERGAVVRSPNRGCYAPHEVVTLTAVPAPDYVFVGWSGDAEGTESPLAVTMDGHRSIVARFDLATTAALLAQFEATRTGRGIELRWRFGTPERVASVSLERAPAAVGPWSALEVAVREEVGAFVALDESAEPGREHFYRLVATLGDGPVTTFGPISARAVGSIAASAITAVSPNPSFGATQIQFALARAGVVRLTVADVAGRRVTTLVDGEQAAGPYTVAWDGTAQGGRVPPGMYFVRLITPDRTVARRLVLVR